MIQMPSSGAVAGPRTIDKCDRLRRKSLAFLANLFKLRKRNNSLAGMRIDEETTTTTTTTKMQRSPRFESPACGSGGGTTTGCRSRSGPQEGGAEAANVSRIPSTLSVAAMDTIATATTAAAACRRASPSHSILTLTPGRTRNIDQDMEALRLSRQDNPFLQEFGDTDPLTLAQVHEHLVRSPPPASWSRSPTFLFSHQQRHRPGYGTLSPNAMLHRVQDDQPKTEGSMEIRDRHSHTFSLLNPTPIRSLSEVRRLHRSADDSVQLMSSE